MNALLLVATSVRLLFSIELDRQLYAPENLTTYPKWRLPFTASAGATNILFALAMLIASIIDIREKRVSQIRQFFSVGLFVGFNVFLIVFFYNDNPFLETWRDAEHGKSWVSPRRHEIWMFLYDTYEIMFGGVKGGRFANETVTVYDISKDVLPVLGTMGTHVMLVALVMAFYSLLADLRATITM